MTAKKFTILVPVDFSDASDKAVEQSIQVAKVTSADIDLLHVLTETEEAAVRTKLDGQAEGVRSQGIACVAMIVHGNVLETINKAAMEGDYSLMVLGTHGAHGLRQNLFGADILKLLRANSCPSVVVQSGTEVLKPFRKILLPVGSHADYPELVDAVCRLASAHNAHIILYSINRPMEDKPDEMIKNINVTKELFERFKVEWSEVNEDQSVYSFGFAKQTLMYAEREMIDLIGIMPYSSQEHSYFANADKERVLTNDHGIPVLCSRGKVRE